MGESLKTLDFSPEPEITPETIEQIENLKQELKTARENGDSDQLQLKAQFIAQSLSRLNYNAQIRVKPLEGHCIETFLAAKKGEWGGYLTDHSSFDGYTILYGHQSLTTNRIARGELYIDVDMTGVLDVFDFEILTNSNGKKALSRLALSSSELVAKEEQNGNPHQ